MLALLTTLAWAQPSPGGTAADASAAAAPAADAAAADAPADATAAPAADTPTLAIDPTPIVGAPAGPPLTGDALRDKTHAVAKLMRCPVCQGLSVADSPSESALAMKKEVEDLVAKGYDEEQILFYFEASYGEFVRLEPKFEGLNLLVWGGPGALVLSGGAWIAWTLRRRRPTPGAPAPGAATATAAAGAEPNAPGGAAPTRAPVADPDLASYLARVREESR